MLGGPASNEAGVEAMTALGGCSKSPLRWKWGWRWGGAPDTAPMPLHKVPVSWGEAPPFRGEAPDLREVTILGVIARELRPVVTTWRLGRPEEIWGKLEENEAEG